MRFKLPLIAAVVAMFALSACERAAPPANPAVGNPQALVKNDTVPGAGAEAVAGSAVSIHYTGYLYNPAAADFKGAQFDSSAGRSPLDFKIGAGSVVPGFEQGVTGMKVGGKRTILIPASLGYGASGGGPIPPNAGLVFDVELVSAN